MKIAQIKLNYLLTLISFLFVSFISIAQESETENESRYKGMNIGSETRILNSKINDKHYKLYVSLPNNYEKEKDKTYPVLYVLDGQWDFANIVTTQGNMNYDRFSPDVIIIGISYAGKEPDYVTLRANDMTPTVLPKVQNSGNAKQFTDVLRNEILPFIDKEYRTSAENRTLAGTSFGGLYTHYVLFNANALFKNYIICNPSLWYDNQLPFSYETDYSKRNTSLNANVFLVSGSKDPGVQLHHKMVKQISSRNYKGLNFKSSIAEGFGHAGTKSEGYAKGILHSFIIKGIKLPHEELNKYTGNYEIFPGHTISIIIHENNLAVKEFNGQTNIPIYAIDESNFSPEGTYKFFEFNKDENDEVISLSAETDPDNIVILKKLE